MQEVSPPFAIRNLRRRRRAACQLLLTCGLIGCGHEVRDAVRAAAIPHAEAQERPRVAATSSTGDRPNPTPRLDTQDLNAAWAATENEPLAVFAPIGNVVAGAAIDPAAMPGSFAFPIVDPHGETPTILGVDWPIEAARQDVLDRFLNALRQTRDGQAQTHVMVFGASHTAADIWVNVLRRGLQAAFGDAGHGFIMPAPPWRAYRHQDIRVEGNHRHWNVSRIRNGHLLPGNYGLMGLTMTSERPDAVSRFRGTFGKLELFLGSPLAIQGATHAGSLAVSIDGAPAEHRYSPTTEPVAAEEFIVPDAVHTVQLTPVGDGPVTLLGATLEREVPGVVVDTLAIPGSRAASMLLWDEEVFATLLARRRPNLIVLAFGTNEVGDEDEPLLVYETHLREVVARLQRLAPEADVLLIGPSDRPMRVRDAGGAWTYQERPRTPFIIDAQRRVAADTGCAYFDLVSFGGGPLHMVAWQQVDPPWAQRDLVHFTSRGYERLGQVVLGHLMRAYTVRQAWLTAGAERRATSGSSSD